MKAAKVAKVAKIKREKIAVLIENLRFECIIGVLDFERERAQAVEVSAKFVAGEFVDYGVVCADFRREFAARKFEFIEDALGFFAGFFADKFPTLKRLKIRVVKPQIIAGAQVGAQGSWKFKRGVNGAKKSAKNGANFGGKSGKNRAENMAENGAKSGVKKTKTTAPNSNLKQIPAQIQSKNGENLPQIPAQNPAQSSENPAQNPAKSSENPAQNLANLAAKFEFGEKSSAKSRAKKNKK